MRTAVALDEVISEAIVVNRHDGTSAYQVRAGLNRPICTNGPMAKLGDFGAICVPHRGNIVANIVEAPERVLAQFDPASLAVKGVAHSSRRQ